MSASAQSKPNFFIIGAPKCGTTALSEYLRGHPNVYISNPKEPHYFSTDILTNYAIRELDKYLACFNESTKQHIAIGEASVAYLLSNIAVKSILSFTPAARFIVMLRHPVELAYSWHSEALYNSYEDELSFERAWSLQDERLAGRCLPRICPDPKLLMYRDIAALGTQMIRLYENVPSERVHVIIFDDFKFNTAGVYHDTLRFLELPSDCRTVFPVINESKLVRSPVLMELSHWVARTKKSLGINMGTGLLEKFNVPRKSRQPLSDTFRHELVSYFKPEVLKLEQLLGRDLSAWKDSVGSP